ncbi:MAG: PAS domain-containing protein [Pseudomonadota bacterium]
MPSAPKLARALAGLLLAALLALAAGCTGGADGAAPRVVDGVLDLRDWDFRKAGMVPLDGAWQFLPGEFADADAIGLAPTLHVPGDWNGFQTSQGPMGGQGYATYRLTINCYQARDLALALPMQHSATRVYVNGRVVASQGVPGTARALSRPAAIQQIVHLDDQPCPLRLVVHVSNFDIRKGGLMRSITLGTRQQVHDRREFNLMRDLFSAGALVVMGLLPIMFFVARRRDRGPLYFGLFCLTFALLIGLIGERVLQPVVAPLGWDRYYQVVFAAMYFTQMLFALFLSTQYPSLFPRWAIRSIVILGVGATVVVALTPAALFSLGVPLMQAGAVLLAACLIAVLARAVLQRRTGALLILLGLLVFIGTTVHDTINFQHLQQFGLVPWGALVCVSMPGVLLSRRFSRALSAEELRHVEQRERADLVVRSTKAGVLDWDAVAGTITYSTRYMEMLGYPPGTPQAQLRQFYDMVHPDEREVVRTMFMTQLRDRSHRNTVRAFEPRDYRLRCQGGDWLWVHAEGIGLCGADGRTLRFICSFIDISATKRHEAEMQASEEALRRSQKRLELVVRGARVGIVDWDGRTHETYYSPHFRELRGYAPDADTSDWPDYFRVMIHPDDRSRVTRRWVAFIQGKGPEGPHGEYYAPEEYRMLRADGSYAWVQVSGMAVREADGFVARWIAAVIDTTGRREQEEALRASHGQIAAQAAQLELQNEALKENVRLREEVERIGRHDIKTPLNSIIAVPRLLREERELSADEDDLLGIVERAGYRILSMVNLSLDLYKMENGSYIFRPDAVDLAGLTAKVIADLRSHAASKGVGLDVVSDPVAPAYAWAEELLCYSLIANLLKNAVEASPEGARVTVTLAREPEPGGVLMDIHNQGAVPLAIRSNFFQKYATAGKASGTGLGAYSAQLMARVQDGAITMRTSDVEGTTISVRLKAAPAGTVPVTARHAGERSRGAVQQLAQLPPLDVLLVDDDEYNLLIVRRFLPSPPLRVQTAINGRIALEMATAQWPDVIFMDLDMPVMGGMEAVGLMRAHEQATGCKRCRIMALSSHDDAETQAAAIAAGFDLYLTKPVTRQAIHAALDEFGVESQAEAGTVSAPGASDEGPRGIDGARDVVIDPDMQPMIGGFIQSRLPLIDALEALAGTSDRAELRRIAHQLSGSFALYGFNWAAAQSRALETSAADVDPAQVQALAAALREHLGQVAQSSV